jgi:hypothetical protein
MQEACSGVEVRARSKSKLLTLCYRLENAAH